MPCILCSACTQVTAGQKLTDLETLYYEHAEVNPESLEPHQTYNAAVTKLNRIRPSCGASVLLYRRFRRQQFPFPLPVHKLCSPLSMPKSDFQVGS